MERNHKLSNLAIMLKRKKNEPSEKRLFCKIKSPTFSFNPIKKKKTRGENIKMYLKSKKVSPSWHSNFLFLFTNYLMIDLYVIVISSFNTIQSNCYWTQQSHRQKLKNVNWCWFINISFIITPKSVDYF